MSEPSKEAMETEQWTMLRTSEFAALRARAEAADGLASALQSVRRELLASIRSAAEENCLDGPWMPAGVCCQINDALAAYEQAKEVKS